MPADTPPPIDEDEPRGPHGERWERVLREWDEEAARPWKDEEER